jgi:hypothetical protein
MDLENTTMQCCYMWPVRSVSWDVFKRQLDFVVQDRSSSYKVHKVAGYVSRIWIHADSMWLEWACGEKQWVVGLQDERLKAIKIPTIPFFSRLMWHLVTHNYSIAAFKWRWFPRHLKTLWCQCRTLHILWWDTWHLNKSSRQADSQKAVKFVFWYKHVSMQLAVLTLTLTRLHSYNLHSRTWSQLMCSLHHCTLNATSCSE